MREKKSFLTTKQKWWNTCVGYGYSTNFVVSFKIVGDDVLGVPPPRVVILEQGVFSRDSSLRSRMTARENAAVKDLACRKCYIMSIRVAEDVDPYNV